MNSEVTRSRFVRGIVLDALWAADGAGMGAGFTFGQLRSGFAVSRVELGAAELTREMNDLLDDGMVKREWDEDLGCNMYAMDTRGRDFKRAGCPWDRIDEFSGKQTF